MFIPGFETQLVGAEKGADVLVTVTFPEDYRAAELAGKPRRIQMSCSGDSRENAV